MTHPILEWAAARSPGWRRAAAFALLAALAALAWGRTVGHQFVWDDQYFIVANPALRSTANIPSFFTDINTMAGKGYADAFAVFRPLRNLSYWMDWEIAGLDPRWWHLHNLVLHTVNAFLVFLLARALLRHDGAALVAAGVFLLHPVQSEAVAWVKCRDDLLATTLSLCFLLLWWRWRPHAWNVPRVAALCLLYLSACLAKESAIVLPLLVVAAAVWLGPPADPAPGASRARPIVLLAALAAVGVVFLLWRHAVIGRTAQAGYMAGSFYPTMLTMTRAGARYLELLFFPHRLVADYIGMDASRTLADPRVWASSALLLLFVAVIAATRRRFPVESFGLAWIVIALLPVSNVVPMLQFMAERFLYFPLVGFALTAGALFRRAARRPLAASAAAALLLAAYGVQAASRAEVWKNSLTLHTRTVLDTPPTALRPRRNLLAALLDAGRYQDALPLATDLWQTSRTNEAVSASHRAEYARHLGAIYIALGRTDEGIALVESAVEIAPSYALPYTDLGTAEGRRGRHDEALAWFERGLEAAPGDPTLLYNRGIALEQSGRIKEAEEALRRAVEAGPDRPNADKALAALLWKQGRIPEAADVYRDALRRWPQDAEIQHWYSEAQRLTRAER